MGRPRLDKSGTITKSICPTIEEHALCVSNGWGWTKVFRAGIAAMVKPDVMMDKYIVMQAKIDALERKLRVSKLPVSQQQIPTPEARKQSLAEAMGWSK
jgi:hypothetical protein